MVECVPVVEIMQLGSQALKLGGKGRGLLSGPHHSWPGLSGEGGGL